MHPARACVVVAISLASLGLTAANPGKTETDARIKSASNLKVLFMNASFMAQDANRQFPAKVSEIYLANKSDGFEPFLSPRTDTKAPPEEVRADDKKAAAWLDANADFVWLGANLKLDSEMQVLAYESPAKVRDKSGINVLHIDGHVQFLTMAQATKLIPNLK